MIFLDLNYQRKSAWMMVFLEKDGLVSGVLCFFDSTITYIMTMLQAVYLGGDHTAVGAQASNDY